ncbi:MAG: ATP-binding protein, partial [Chitinophagaceae bacterium]
VKYIDFAMDGADRMKKLILDLLEYSRISSFNQKLVLIDLNNLIINIKFSLKLVIDESNASVVVNPLPKIYGNESQIMQLFQNLISNALKFRNEQSPVVDIGFEDRDREWLFYVKDNGIGIESKFFEKIFVIFQRLHNRNKYDGTGIGLAICKKIVELHGGRIWVESGNNDGTIFYFTIGKMLANSPESK